MSRARTVWRLGALLLASALACSGLPGCWSAARISEARAQRSIAAGDPRVLVVPLNVSVALGEGLEAVVEPVQREILSQLSQQGARVSFLAVEDARALWSQTVQTLRSLDRNTASLEVVAGTFVRSLRSEVDFDFVLMPSLGYREAGVERGYASWDGVRRSLTARNREWALSERIPAFSLYAQVYLPDGRIWYQRWAGIDVVYRSDLDAHLELSDEQIDEDRDFIREGVALALARKSSADQ